MAALTYISSVHAQSLSGLPHQTADSMDWIHGDWERAKADWGAHRAWIRIFLKQVFEQVTARGYVIWQAYNSPINQAQNWTSTRCFLLNSSQGSLNSSPYCWSWKMLCWFAGWLKSSHCQTEAFGGIWRSHRSSEGRKKITWSDDFILNGDGESLLVLMMVTKCYETVK